MKREQDAADAAAAPALLFWSRLIQAAAAVVIILSLTLLLTPRLGEAIFNLVYFHQPTIPVEVPNLAMGYIWLMPDPNRRFAFAEFSKASISGWRTMLPKTISMRICTALLTVTYNNRLVDMVFFSIHPVEIFSQLQISLSKQKILF